MVGKVELIPLSEGNRITVKENEKVIVGRGSSLGVRSNNNQLKQIYLI